MNFTDLDVTVPHRATVILKDNMSLLELATGRKSLELASADHCFPFGTAQFVLQ